MQYKNLTIIGTSHIAKESVNEVEKAFESDAPDILAIELDRGRLHGLMSGEKPTNLSIKDILRIGLKGYLFSLIGAWAERKMGSYVGVSPGSEMKKAAELAIKNGKKIALIDRPIEKTLKDFSKRLTWKEKSRFVVDIFKAFFQKDKFLAFDLRKVPSKKIIRKLTDQLKIRYPNVYDVLITKRNKYMAAKLSKIMGDNLDKKILAVVGAGHEEDIIELLEGNKISYSVTFG